MAKTPEAPKEEVQSGSIIIPADQDIKGSESLRFAIAEHIDASPDTIAPFDLGDGWLEELRTQLPGYEITSLKPTLVEEGAPFVALFINDGDIYAANVDKNGKHRTFGDAAYSKSATVQALTIAKRG